MRVLLYLLYVVNDYMSHFSVLNDIFIRHPAMDLSRRAKIFNPFDALKGFSDELSKAQEEVTDTFLDETGPIEETP